MSLEGSDGVTVVVRRTIRADATEAFEAWLMGINQAAARFEGHSGVQIIPPGQGEDWVIIFHFASGQQLSAWESSPERAEWLRKVEPMTVSSSLEKVTGLEFWFVLPGNAARRPPPPWKMALVTLVGLYPLVLWVAPRLSDAFDAMPAPLTTLTTVAIMVVLMTWLVMPALVRLLRPWLFAD